MSTKVVRKLLQQTSGFTGAPLGESNKKRKREERREVDEEALVKHHVQSMLALDRRFVGGNDRSKRVRQMNEKSKKATSRAKKSKGSIGNSRTSSSEFQQRKQERTVDKKLYKKEKEEERLRAIARLLEKTKKKLQKGSKMS